MDLLRKLLLPIVPVYYLVTWFRNKLYDWGIKKSKSYDFPILAVGNLSTGGTGKTPMVEYLVRLLKDKTTIAILSRGYKRKTKGYQEVTNLSTAIQVGDEPLQFKKKFNTIYVAVDSNRQNGITRLRSYIPKPKVIVLDDAYQHRKVKAGFYILLTSYGDLYCNDIVLPTGNLREPRKGANRANIIVITKCPDNLGTAEKNKIIQRLATDTNQQVFFTTIVYSNVLMSSSSSQPIDWLKSIKFTLVTGIANPKPLVDYYTSLGFVFEHVNFPDHHHFTDKELKQLQAKELIITTEKDYVRLADHISDHKLWYQPIEVSFLENSKTFDTAILHFIESAS